MKWSQIIDGSLIAAGAFLFAVACILPVHYEALQFVNATFAAIMIAIGVNRFRFGQQGVVNRAQFSLASLVVATLVLAVFFAVFSTRLRDARADRDRHNAAIQRVTELGGTVQQGMVSLAGTNVTDADLVVLEKLDMWDLNLGATNISNTGLSHIPLEKLQNLNLSGTNVDDAGLRRLAPIPHSLRSLKLRMTRVTGTAFPLSRSSGLEQIDLSRCPITGNGLRALARMDLDYLILAETDLNDAHLETLEMLQVKVLDLTDSKVSPAGLRTLQAARPEMKILVSNQGERAKRTEP